MDPAIVAALILAAATISVAAVPIIVRWWRRRRKRPSGDEPRHDSQKDDVDVNEVVSKFQEVTNSMADKTKHALAQKIAGLPSEMPQNVRLQRVKIMLQDELNRWLLRASETRIEIHGEDHVLAKTMRIAMVAQVEEIVSSVQECLGILVAWESGGSDLQWLSQALSEIKVRLAIRKNLRTPRSTKSLGLIYFNYPSGDPRMHDWSIHTPPHGSEEPVFKSLIDGNFGRVLQIIPKCSYSMDHDVSQDESSATQVNVTLKPGAEWFVCFNVRVVSSDGSIGRDVWLSAKFSKKDALYYIDSKVEWKIELPKTILEKDWALLSINLPESVEATFGKEGWEYQKLTRIRLRGDFTIARIEFLGA